MKTVIKNLKLIIIVALCFVLAAPFSACKKPQQDLTSGITIKENAEVEYSLTTTNMATNAIYGFLCEYHTLVGSTVLTDKSKGRYKSAAKTVQEITAKEKVLEEDYLKFFKSLKDNTEEYAKSFNNLRNGSAKEEDQEVLKGAFKEVTALWGADAVASVLYELMLYRYDCKYADGMETFNQYKDQDGTYKLVAESAKKDAEKAAEDKTVLASEVKKENFIPTVKLFFMLGEIFFGGGFNEGFLSSLSGEELVLILSEPDFSGIDITDKGWELILSNTESVLISSYYKSLMKVAVNSGDVKAIASNMQTAIELICAIQNSIDNAVAEHLINGDNDKFIAACFNKFGDSEWAAFQKVTSVNINKDEYHKEATAYYGKGYTDYASSVKTYTFNELLNATNSDEFTSVLKGYFAGICPAFTYRGNK